MNRPTEIMPQQEEGQPTRERKSREHQAHESTIHGTHATRDSLVSSSTSGRALLLACFLALPWLLSSACSKPIEKGEEKRDIVDIAGPKDAALSFDDDVQAQRREEGLAGVLPGGFPRDLPLFDPASVVDTSETEEGRMVVVLQHPATPHQVESFLDRELPAAGWSSNGGSSYRNSEGREVEISVEALGAVTRARIVF